jgi:transcriptional adapter 2-alpha
MKFRLIDIYNHKLDERLKRKEFVITRGLLDLKEQMRLEKNRTKEEKEIYNMMKVFARFSSAKEHEELVKGIIREKQIRQRIEELKDFKKKGFRTLQ